MLKASTSGTLRNLDTHASRICLNMLCALLFSCVAMIPSRSTFTGLGGSARFLSCFSRPFPRVRSMTDAVTNGNSGDGEPLRRVQQQLHGAQSLNSAFPQPPADYEALTNTLRPITDCFLTIRVIKSFEYRTTKNVLLPHVDASHLTVGQLKDQVRECNQQKNNPGARHRDTD